MKNDNKAFRGVYFLRINEKIKVKSRFTGVLVIESKDSCLLLSRAFFLAPIYFLAPATQATTKQAKDES